MPAQKNTRKRRTKNRPACRHPARKPDRKMRARYHMVARTRTGRRTVRRGGSPLFIYHESPDTTYNAEEIIERINDHWENHPEEKIRIYFYNSFAGHIIEIYTRETMTKMMEDLRNEFPSSYNSISNHYYFKVKSVIVEND